MNNALKYVRYLDVFVYTVRINKKFTLFKSPPI